MSKNSKNKNSHSIYLEFCNFHGSYLRLLAINIVEKAQTSAGDEPHTSFN